MLGLVDELNVLFKGHVRIVELVEESLSVVELGFRLEFESVESSKVGLSIIFVFVSVHVANLLEISKNSTC